MGSKREGFIKRIKLEGYKSIKSLDIPMKPINILIGANGSGKTNFISLFSMLRAMSQGKFQKYVEDKGRANSLLHFGVKNTDKIKIELNICDNGYSCILGYDSFEDTIKFENEYCSFETRWGNKDYGVQGKGGESGLFEGWAESNNVRDYTKHYLDKCAIYHFHDTSDTAGFKSFSNLDANHYLEGDASNIAAFLYYLKHNYEESYIEILDAVRVVAPFFHDFYLEPIKFDDGQQLRLRWIHKEYDNPFSPHSLSDGTARFICMATLFLQPQHLRPKTIILDEPELGLHPAALAVLADIIKSVSKYNQVICSTQSVELANYFEPEDFIVVEQKKGVSYFERPDAKSLEVWLEEYRMGEIWNKNLIGGRPEW